MAACDWRLGNIYAYGELGYDKDLAKAIGHYKRCAEAGGTDCDAQLGYFYRVDPSIDLTPEQAVAHLRKAAEAGVSLAAENLAYAFYAGSFGLKQDMDEAAVWIVSAMKLPGGAAVRDWLASDPNAMKNPKFWKALHKELKNLGLYNGPASSEKNAESIAALYQLQ